MLFSGRLGGVVRQGVAVVVSVALWGISIAGFGLAVAGAGSLVERGTALWVGAVCLACAGAADSVSSVFRNTILQSATPDHLRGRLQGVFIVVVAGGPRLGDLVAGTGAAAYGEAVAAIVGGLPVRGRRGGPQRVAAGLPAVRRAPPHALTGRGRRRRPDGRAIPRRGRASAPPPH